MSLEGFPNLKHLDGLVQLPCLEELDLVDMPTVESISGGPFASLSRVKIKRLCSLEEVWIVADRTLFGKEREGYSKRNHHQSGQLQIGCCFIDLHIQDCPKLVVRPHFPISLEHLWLVESNDNLLLSPLRSQGSSSTSKSTPSFSHLKVLKLWYMKAPLSLSPPFSPGFRLELLQHMTALESLKIFICSDLIELPEYLGNLLYLQRMAIKNCDRLSGLPQSIGHLTSLQELIIQECPALVKFPESLCHLTFLKELDIGDCKALVQLPEGLGELCSLSKLDIWCLPGLTCLPQSLCNLMSLQELQIGGCDVLGELPECLGELHSLRKLKISELDSITCLPQSLCCLTTSLKVLEIRYCPGLTSLPEGIKGLTALQRLVIDCCPELERRCQRGNGEDWHLISHIPNLQIGEPCDEGPAY